MEESKSQASSVAEHDVKEPGKIEALLGAIKPHHPEKGAHVSIDENTPIREVKDPNIFERAKEEFDAVAQAVQQKKEFSSDTSLPVEDESPKVEPEQGTNGKLHHFIGKAKEEFHAIVHKDRDGRSKETSEPLPIESESSPEKHGKTHQLIHRKKEELKSLLHLEKPPKENHVHQKETHGTSGSIDENTPLTEVKAPNVFERAKEEVQALVQTVHHSKKQAAVDPPPPPVPAPAPREKEEGCVFTLARGFQKVCAPWTIKKEE
ncbi:hypothetical protein Droror1_Dr00007186 [Drosera rotundifolia]